MAIRDLTLPSAPGHRITATVAARGVNRGELANLHSHDFRWAGKHLTRCEHLDVHHSRIENAGPPKHRWHHGLICIRRHKRSEIHHNATVSAEGESDMKGPENEAESVLTRDSVPSQLPREWTFP